LTERSEINIINFKNDSKYMGTSRKPDSLKLDLPMLDEAFYYELKLGNPATTRYLVFGRINSSKWVNVMYFDANADGTVTKDEAVQITYTTFSAQDGKLMYSFARPSPPLRIEMKYNRADGTSFSKVFSLSFETISIYDPEQTKMTYPVAGAFVTPGTYLVGEVATSGDRVCKAAVVDGNMNGIYNEAGKDFLVLDLNHDGKFDCAKERTSIDDDLSGQSSDGKKTKLMPFVAAWPQVLCLSPKDKMPDPAQLETR